MRRIKWCLIFGIPILSLLIGNSEALAARTPSVAVAPQSINVGTNIARSTPTHTQKWFRDLFTPARLRSAIPVPFTTRPDPAPSGSTASMWQGQQQVFPRYGQGYLSSLDARVGRLYTVSSAQPNQIGSCTATVVAVNVVLTAAHCVFANSSGLKNTAFAFIPAQNGGNGPYGTWYGQVSTAYDYYWQIHGQDGFGAFTPMDYGFVVLNQNASGRNVGNVVGIANMLYNSPGGAIFHSGYPGSGQFAANCPSDGTFRCYQWYCYAPVGAYANQYNGWYEVGFGCTTGHGASGGPMWQNYQGTWYVASVADECWSRAGANGCANSSDNMWGPYFNSYTAALFQSLF